MKSIFSHIIHFCSKQIPVHADVFLVIVLTCFAFDEIISKELRSGFVENIVILPQT